MKKREKGVLTVEASIVLTLMLLCILFLFSFAQVYRAQNMVSHAAIQSADAVALESYLRETALRSDIGDVVYLASHLSGSSAISPESLESLRSANLPKIARQKFISAIANSEELADLRLKSLGIKDGIDGVNFAECKMDLANDDVIIAIKYTIEMQFPVFGFKEIDVTKSAKAKTFGEILFEVSTEPNNPGWGSTSGDDKVTHGTDVVITAKPNYGYKFVSWDDGVTDNPRIVTVNDSKHYKAIFEKDSFGVNIEQSVQYDKTYAGISHESQNYGTVSGAGNYLYLDKATVTATPAANYEFVGWSDGVKDNPRIVTVDKIYHFKAVFKPSIKTVSVQSNNGSYGSAMVSQGGKSGSSIQVEYGSRVQLTATSADSVKYIFVAWSNNSTQSTVSEIITQDITYVAIFDWNTYEVNFYDGSKLIHTTTVIRKSSIDGSKNALGSSMGYADRDDGVTFGEWRYNGSRFDSSTRVYGNIDVYAAWKYNVTLNANGGSISGSSTASYSVWEGSAFDFSSYNPYKNGYKFNGWYKDGTKYSGSKTISANITVTASWECKHMYDNGTSMLYDENTVGDGKCGECEVTVKCRGCTYSDIKKMVGACEWGANCGVDHEYNLKLTCTASDTKHYWGTFRCITCKHCGTCKNKKPASEFGNQIGEQDKKNYAYFAGSTSKLCGAHNGKDMRKYKEVVNAKAHK